MGAVARPPNRGDADGVWRAPGAARPIRVCGLFLVIFFTGWKFDPVFKDDASRVVPPLQPAFIHVDVDVPFSGKPRGDHVARNVLDPCFRHLPTAAPRIKSYFKKKDGALECAKCIGAPLKDSHIPPQRGFRAVLGWVHSAYAGVVRRVGTGKQTAYYNKYFFYDEYFLENNKTDSFCICMDNHLPRTRNRSNLSSPLVAYAQAHC